jgi:hypothetical protein
MPVAELHLSGAPVCPKTPPAFSAAEEQVRVAETCSNDCVRTPNVVVAPLFVMLTAKLVKATPAV